MDNSLVTYLTYIFFFKRYDNCIFPSTGLLEISKAHRISHRSRGHFSLQHAEENMIVVTPVQRVSFKPNESSKPVVGKQEISVSSPILMSSA